MSDNEVLIRVRNLSFAYDGNLVLDDVSLEICAGDFLGLVGPNGGGKTTLVKLILGILRPMKGTIEVFGETPQKGRERIGYVPQYARYNADFPVTVESFVLMGRLRPGGIGRRYSADDRDAARKALAELSLEHLAKRDVKKLSGGEKQRVLVARALATAPDALFLDEPTVSVDSAVEKHFYDVLQELNARMPIVLVSHDLGFISSYLTRVACLNRRLVVSPVSELHAHDLEAMYHGPVKAWSHDCEI